MHEDNLVVTMILANVPFKNVQFNIFVLTLISFESLADADASLQSWFITYEAHVI